MSRLCGWTGKILRVDLSAREVTTIETTDYVPAYVGGLGIAARIAWDELKPGVGPFDPENILFVMVGPLTGTLASGGGRVVVAGIAPQQRPAVFSRSGMGGHWGAECKYAGYDGLVIVGRATSPVYLWVNDGHAELRAADDLWGRGTYATTTILRQRHGPAVRVISCGQAGENLARVACIHTETGNAAGQGGYGAVMGAKKLKAVAVRGTGSVQVADPQRLIDLALGASREGLSYRRSGRRGGARGRDAELPIAHHRKKCGFCASDCSSYRFMAAPGTTTGDSITVHPFCYRFRQDTEAWLETSKLTADLGINGWETAYGIIPWLQMCKQRGLVDPGWERSELDGIEIPVPDEPIQELRDIAPIPAEFSSTLLRKMAYREGELGDAVADGACYAAQALFGGQGLPLLDYIYPRRAGQTSHWNAHWIHPVRFPFLMVPLLQWATDTRDPASDAIHGYTQHMLTYLSYSGWEGGALDLEQAKSICAKVYGEPDVCDPQFTYDRPETKAIPAMYHHHRGMVNNCMVLCERETIRVFSMESDDYAADTALMAKLYEAVTGEAMDDAGLDEAGERVYNLLRAIDVRNYGRARHHNGVSGDEWARHEDWATVRDMVGPSIPDGIPLNLEQFSVVLDRYYEMRGWNPETGWPTRARLEGLRLGDVADGLEAVGKLG